MLDPRVSYLVTETRWPSRVRVSVYDPTHNELIDYGWVSADDLVGRTAIVYDWGKRIGGE